MSSWTASTRSDGACRSPRAPCSCGHPFPSRSAPWARSSSRSSSSTSARWPCRPASASANTARASCGSPSSRTSSASSRPSAASRRSPRADGAADIPPDSVMNEIKIGLLGLGTVGSGVVKVLQTHGAEMQERAGCRLRLHAIADADTTRPRDGLDLARLPLVSDAARVLDDPSVQIVIELVGGLEPARSFILKALDAGKHVVTANKALLAHHGPEIFEAARRNRVMLGFEAAVAGGVPLLRSVTEGLPANRVLSAFGIVNGTCNYILSKMTDERLDFSVVLKEAQAHGYAEADPTLDIEGMDSAHKLQILATLAFRTAVDLKDIHTEGITAVSQQDVENAAELGYRI